MTILYDAICDYIYEHASERAIAYIDDMLDGVSAVADDMIDDLDDDIRIWENEAEDWTADGQACPRCGGSGGGPEAHLKCPDCGGSGRRS